MKTGRITIKDIAKELGMSFSTVARALKDNYTISEATRNRVKAYAASKNYRPNLVAQSLKNKGSRSIGVSLCAIPNNFYAEVLNGIESIAYDNNYQVIITQSNESYEKEIKNVEHLAWRSVDGVLVSLSSETKDIGHLAHLLANGTSVVFFDRVCDLPGTHSVVADNMQGAYDATIHLAFNGYKRIAHFTSSPNLSITNERLEGYKKALAEQGINIDQDLIKYCEHGGMIREEIEKGMNELLLMGNRPDALLTASDRITIGCFSILKQKGINIPDQIALAGFSNFSSPELFSPSLTTIKQPAFEMGKIATELLLQVIESKKPVVKRKLIVLPAELIVRDSSQRK